MHTDTTHEAVHEAVRLTFSNRPLQYCITNERRRTSHALYLPSSNGEDRVRVNVGSVNRRRPMEFINITAQLYAQTSLLLLLLCILYAHTTGRARPPEQQHQSTGIPPPSRSHSIIRRNEHAGHLLPPHTCEIKRVYRQQNKDGGRNKDMIMIRKGGRTMVMIVPLPVVGTAHRSPRHTKYTTRRRTHEGAATRAADCVVSSLPLPTRK